VGAWPRKPARNDFRIAPTQRTDGSVQTVWRTSPGS
jgi:hypothetical protein